MKTKLTIFAFLLVLASPAYPQTGGPLTPASSSTGAISTNSASCFAASCVVIHMATSNVGYSVTVSGTWTGTLTIEQSGDNQTTWTSVTTTTANTLYTSALTPGITDARVRGSAAMTGSAVVTITASGPATIQNITQTGGSGGPTPVAVLPSPCGTTNTLVQLTVAPFGIYVCNSSGVFLGPYASSNGAAIAQNYGVVADLQVVTDATISNGSGNVTTGGSDSAFTTADNNKACYATTGGGPVLAHINGKLSMPQGTFTQTGAHTGTCSTTGNANASGTNTNWFIWATDDTAAMTAAYTAATVPGWCNSLILPGTAFLVNSNLGSTPVSNLCAANFIGVREGLGIIGTGGESSVMVIGPNFNFSTQCTVSNTCLFTQGGLFLSNFGIWGSERGDCPATANGKNLLGINGDSKYQYLVLAGWCSNATLQQSNGIANLAGGVNLSHLVVDGFGTTCGSFSTGDVAVDTAWFGDCTVIALSVSGGVVNSFSNYIGDVGNPNGNLVQTGGILQSTNDSCLQFNASQQIFLRIEAGAVANFVNLQCYGATTGNSSALWVNGGKVNLTSSTLQGGSTGGSGLDWFIDTNGILNDIGGNKFAAGANHTLIQSSGGTLIADGHSVKGIGTGLCTASSTLGLYGTGPNVTVTTCTSAAIGTGIPVNGARQLMNLVVKASVAGTTTSTITVLVNGGASVMTCNLTTGLTLCSDTTHQVALNDGDLVSLQIATLGATDPSGIKAFVEWN